MVAGSPAWLPQAMLALVTTSSIAASSPIRQGPKPSPRSELRSILTALFLKLEVFGRRSACVAGWVVCICPVR